LAVSLIKQLKGEYYRSPFVYKLMFGQYNRRYENVLSPYDWLTRDREVVAAYEADEYCNFRFTASGSLDLLRLLGYVSSKEWYHSVPKGMPTFVISGTMDPVGNFGKGIETFEKKLKEHGMTRLSVKLYPDMRHELLNELGKEEVYDDILAWLEEHI
jgi:alpha-beta hydrolase superfamily lysophospholipase